MQIKAINTKDYIRIFFYCDQPTKFTPHLRNDSLIVTFDKSFNPDFSNISKTLSKDIEFATSSTDGETLLFKLSGNKFGYRKFLGENFVGIDLIRKKTPVTKEAVTPPPPTLPAKIAAKKTTTPPPALKPNKKAELSLQRKFTQTATEEKIEVAQAEIPEEKTLEEPIENTNSGEIKEEIEDGEIVDVKEPENKIAQISTDEETENEINEADNLGQLEGLIEEKEKQANASKEEKIRDFTEKSTISFNFETPETGAAVFTRGDYLWVIFDRYKEFDISKIVSDNSQYFTDESEQIDNKYYTIIRLKMIDPLNTVAYKSENEWTVAITEKLVPTIYEPKIDLSINELTGSKVSIFGQEDINPLRMIDPAVGDEIIILPYTSDNIAINVTRKYPDFYIIKTAQGAVINLIADGVLAEVAGEKVSIAGPTNKLAGSAQAELRELREKELEAKRLADLLKQKGNELTLLQFKNWKLGGDATYSQDIVDLQWKITEANWNDKSSKRLELARFYFAHGFYKEALGVLEIIKEFDPKYAKTKDVRFLEGATKYMSRRYKDALDLFESFDLKDKKLKEREAEEIKFWKAATNLRISNLIQVDQFMSNNPLNEKKEGEIDEGSKIENTRLMRDTSERLLKIIRKMDPDFVNADELQKLESTARFVTSHYHEEIKRFEESDLYATGDAFEAEENKLWWSASDVRANNATDFVFTKNIDSFLKYYPDHIFNDFALLGLEDKLKKNDLVSAEEILSSFKEENRHREANSIKFLTGLFNAKDEESDKAIEIWETLAKDIDDGFNRIRSQYALTVLLLKEKQIEVADAIDRLNTVRSAWRGGVLEFHVLKTLGEFYMEEKNYMEGMKVWRNTIAAFPGSDEALLVAKKMSEKFVQIFSHGEADNMDKFDALSLFLEFRELTPIGKLGDEMITRFADRLVDVDLLDRASALLTHQVRFRLSGDDKQNAIVKLVNIHLMNRQPQEALDVLRATKSDNISNEMKLERKYIEARSLIELDKSNMVLALLKGDESQRASFLRAEVYWRNQVWKKVVDELETPFRDIRREEKMLSKAETEQLLRLSVAYALTENKKRLQILYEDFVDLLPNNENKKIFTFVSTDRGPVDHRNLEHTLEYNNIKDFLIKYMDKTSAADS